MLCVSIVFSIVEYILWIYHNFLIHLLVGGHLDYFQVLTIKAAMNICVEFIYGHMLSCPMSKYLVVERLDCIGVVSLTFSETC